jgi:hypothetical protein
MKCSKQFGAKRRGFLNIKIILAPKGASRFRTQNIRYDKCYKTFSAKLLMFCLKGYADSDVNYFEKSFITLNEVFDVIKLFPPNY